MSWDNYENKSNKIMDLRKEPSCKTIRINRKAYCQINWDKLKVESDFAKEGLLVAADNLVIKQEGSLIPAWSLKAYDFLKDENIPYSVNPKLWIQGNLNLNAGLFKVTENIYQIRGFDTANMTFIKGKTGWIVIDCLNSAETSEAALNFFSNYFGKISISAVIITHSHEDHYGGVLSVVDRFIDDNVKIYVPSGYVNAVVMENVTAGSAMSHRGAVQYGSLLRRDEKGQIDIGIGKGISVGTVTFTKNVEEIVEEYSIIKVDGIEMEFLLALDTEAPSEMVIFIPSEKALCIAEDANATLHNLYTLRGAKVRDALAWANTLQETINLWGKKLKVVFGVHNWPRFGRAESIDYLEKQRDLYQYINDQTLRLINYGYTIDEVGRMIEVPESITDEWYNSQFYGTFNHDAKGVYQRYLGWYNSNAVDLNKLLPQDSAKKYVEYMGGEECVLQKARTSFEMGEYQWVAEVTKQVIYANPNNREAKLLCADALEQLGYICESGTWRNEYLTGAQELRTGIAGVDVTIISEEVLNNIPLENVFYLLSIRLNGVKAGWLDYKINFIISDIQQVATTQVKRGIFRWLSDDLSSDAAVTVAMTKEVLNKFVSTNEKPSKSEVELTGDVSKWYEFLSLIEDLNPKFNIMTPVESPPKVRC